MQSYNPNNALTLLVWAVPFSLATTGGITIVFFSTGYLDVSVQRVGHFRSLRTGFPIRKSADHGLFPPPHSISQVITSFIASESQGILHAPLLTFFVSTFVVFSYQYVKELFPLRGKMWRITDSNR